MTRNLIPALFLWAALSGSAMAEDRLPIFDTHVHYSENSWDSFSPGAIKKLFERAGVTRALVSSTPDDGSLKLAKAMPGIVIPELRPYHGEVTSSSWMRHILTVAYLEDRLATGKYRGIGEFHLFDADDARTPTLKRVSELAVHYDIPLHVHSDAAPVKVLFTLDPKLKVLWAHAGFFEPPEVVSQMLDTYPNLSTEVSFRANDISAGGDISAAWRALFERHPERIMIGTDTYVADRWAEYYGLIGEHRQWLEQLPPDLARKIAYENAFRILGVKP